MKNIFNLCGFVFLILLSLLQSCIKEEIPTLTTNSITNISGTSAIGGGTIINEGTGTIIARGLCWSKEITPTLADNKTAEGAGAGTFISNISGLNGATTYYVRAYATNSAGTGYGMAMSFSTFGETPGVSTYFSSITTTSVKLSGIIDPNYLLTTVTFEYGTTISYGSTISGAPNTIIGVSPTSVDANISGLSAGTTYHFRIKAVNSLGTTYSEDMSFKTLGQAPTASTKLATNLSKVAATLNGVVNANYFSTSVTFEYGLTISYGSSIGATPSTVTGTASSSVIANISSLTAGMTYHFRVKATNSLGTTNGEDVSFVTPNPIMSTMTDIDGNVYKSVIIDTQTWMAENLKTTKYRNGDLITTVFNGDDWLNTTSGAFTFYNNDISNNATYGKLYNGYAVADSRRICPTGWHVPSSVEWAKLITFLGGETVAGGKMKEEGQTHWLSPNLGATNESGFTALPGGYRGGDYLEEGYDAIYGYGGWWSAMEVSVPDAWYYLINRNDTNIGIASSSTNKKYGFSVRCMKD